MSKAKRRKQADRRALFVASITDPNPPVVPSYATHADVKRAFGKGWKGKL